MVESYSVNPAKWTVYMKEDYEITPQTGFTLTFNNDGNYSISIRLSVYNDPSKTKKGYEPLSAENFSWIKFAETDFTIPPNTVYEVPIIIDIPNETVNYNRSWQFFIRVDQYAGGPHNATAVFQYDYNLVWFIETPLRYVPVWERGNHTLEKSAPIFFVTVLIIIGVYLWYSYSKKKKRKLKKVKNNAKQSSAKKNHKHNNTYFSD